MELLYSYPSNLDLGDSSNLCELLAFACTYAPSDNISCSTFVDLPDMDKLIKAFDVMAGDIYNLMADEVDFYGSPRFSDVAKDVYAIAWARYHKLVFGYEDGKFLPNKKVCRAEAAAVFYRLADD